MKMIKHEKPQHAQKKTENKLKLTCYFTDLSKVKLTTFTLSKIILHCCAISFLFHGHMIQIDQ